MSTEIVKGTEILNEVLPDEPKEQSRYNTKPELDNFDVIEIEGALRHVLRDYRRILIGPDTNEFEQEYYPLRIEEIKKVLAKFINYESGEEELL